MYHKHWGLKIILLVCLLSIFVSDSSIFAKEWYEYYREAMQAGKEKDWETAIQLLQQAIKNDPNPAKRKKVRGIRFIQYYPYLALGRAYLGIGNHEAARRACEESKKRDVAPRMMVERCLRMESSFRLSSPQNTSQPSKPDSQPSDPPPQAPDPPPQAQDSVFQSSDQERVKIAVLDFRSLMVSEEFGIAVAEIFRTKIVGLGNYTVIERGMIEQVLKEQELQLTGAVDSETAIEIGKLVGAQFVIIGSIMKTGTVYTINARLIEVETGIAKVGENITGQSEDEIPDMVAELIMKMIRKAGR